MDALKEEIDKQQTLFNDLRAQKADAATLDEAKKRLADLKKQLGQSKAAAGVKDGGKKRERLLLKTAKGTRDYGPGEMFCREHIERIVRSVFTAYGGSCVDTPVFERKDILTGKYGEDSKLIFDLKDQGGEELALRYDHTVPLARYLAMMGGNNTHSKIYQLSKVYRRDNPVMSKGRMREFSQADFDIIGQWDTMIPDAEIISVICSVISKLDVGDFTIKLNNRKILDGIFEVCGVPEDKIRPISSAVDKLDKAPWSEVRKEMTEEKGLDGAVADRIWEYVQHKGGPSLLDTLRADEKLMSNARAREGVEEMSLLFKYLDAYKLVDKMSFDLSLARGLDYYTGVIYEAVCEASAPPGFTASNALASGSASAPGSSTAPLTTNTSTKKPKKTAADGEEDEVDESTVGVGSIAAGGRYDNLVGMFTAAAAGEGKKGLNMPCVGVAIGLDRIFSIVWPKWVEKGMRSKETMVYVMAAGDGLLVERIRLVQELREAGIKADFLMKNKPKLPAQFAAGERDEAPFAIILGESELKEGLVTVKEQAWEFVDGKKEKKKSSDKGTQVKRAELIDWIKSTKVFKDWDLGRLIVEASETQ